MKRAVYLLSFLLLLASVALAQTVRIDGKVLPYKLIDGKQMISRALLAKTFPGFPGGEGMVDLAVLANNPNARIMRREGTIISVRYYNSGMAALYTRPERDPNRTQIMEGQPASSGGQAQFRAMMNEIVRLSNVAREANGVPPVTAHHTLEEAAIGHSEEMLKLDFFSHTSPTAGRETPHVRIMATGSRARRTGENIATFSGHPESSIAAKSVDGWMNSPGHRRNLLDPSFTHMGIGVAKSGLKFMVTQNFSDQP